MKGVPIKFRGTTIVGDKFVYGNVIIGKGGLATIVNDDGNFDVVLNTVVQLVGYDSEGTEVYEGDIIDEFYSGLKHRFAYFTAGLWGNIKYPPKGYPKEVRYIRHKYNKD